LLPLRNRQDLDFANSAADARDMCQRRTVARDEMKYLSLAEMLRPIH
jgi:hypothetical protein